MQPAEIKLTDQFIFTIFPYLKEIQYFQWEHTCPEAVLENHVRVK